MPWGYHIAVKHLAAKPCVKNTFMAKSETPTLVVQKSTGTANSCCIMDQQHPSGRPSRLEKQEEFEEEEDIVYMPSPVTIQIEDRGGGPYDPFHEAGLEELIESGGNMIEPSECGATAAEGGDLNDAVQGGRSKDSIEEGASRSKVPSHRVKLLVRSQAVHDDASPPPDLESVVTNTNMLSVTNVPAFVTQTQSKSSSKNRLGRQGSSQGSQGSTESSSGLSRDSSTETYTDSTGIDLQQFIIDTLHKNQKDRMMLLKIEHELITLVKDSKKHSYKFGQMSSYNRMLVHRVAAFFGMDHYVDANGTSVIVNKTKNTRMPDSRFQDHIRDELLPEEPKKSILKRDSISFEEGKEKSPERQSSTDSRRGKSFEEREEEYEKARARIFNQDEGFGESPMSRRGSQEDIRWPSSDTKPWSSTDSDSSGRPLGARAGSSFETEGVQQVCSKADKPVAVLTKAESDTKEQLLPTRAVRPVMTKASSFGGISVLAREGSGGRNVTPKITKAESFNITSLSDGISSCQAAVTSTSSPLGSSSIGLQTSSPGQFPASTLPQTFPVVAGQPTQLQISLQQFSSQQVAGWPMGSRDVPVSSDYAGHSAISQQPFIWPVSTAPDLVLLSPQGGSPYVNVENVFYRCKLPQQSNGQTIMLAPFQPLVMPAPSQVPNSVASAISPPTQHQQPPPPTQQTLQPNVQLSVPLHQPQQPQQQPHQQQTVQIPQPQPVIYIPYIPSQIQTAVGPQPSVGNIPTAIQTVQPPQVQQSQVQQSQQPQQQQQPQPLPQPSHLIGDQRPYSINPTSVEDITVQISGLNLIPSQQPQQEGQPPSRQNLVNLSPSSPPQSFVVPTFKSQAFVASQGSTSQFPVCYVPQVQQATSMSPIRYVFPTGSSVSQPGSSSGPIPLSGQVLPDMQSHVSTQASSQVAGPSYLPGYPLLSLSQTGETSSTSTFVSYTMASQTAAITTTTSVLIPSSPISTPIYPYGNVVIGNLGSSTPTQFSTPTTTQSAQQPPYIQTPSVPMYVITTTSVQTPAAAHAQVGSNVAIPLASFRSQSLPAAPSSSSGAQSAQFSTNSTVGYAIYAPQQIVGATSLPHTSPSIAQNTHTAQPATTMPATILTTFQVLRPNLPLVGNLRTGTPPPTQNVLSQYSSPPPDSKVPMSFPLVKQASDPGCFGFGNAGSRGDQSKSSRTAQLQLLSPTASGPTGGLVCRRGPPVIQDMCLLGPPLQHHFGPLLLPQQRAIARFMHPTSSSSTNRPPKNRTKKGKTSQSSGSKSGSSVPPVPQDISGGNMLEIEGLPDGMKRSELERYLEQVTCHGAKIQCLDRENYNVVSSDSDFVLANARHLVVAVFESDSAVQSALLGIKTPKFQLRPLSRSTKDMSLKKYS